MTVVAITVVATLVMVVITAVGNCLMFTLRNHYQKQKLSLTLYDVPYNYALPPLPPCVQRMDSELYDTISNNDMELETVLSTSHVQQLVIESSITELPSMTLKMMTYHLVSMSLIQELAEAQC